MADETSKLGIDASGGIKSLQDLIAQFRKYNTELVSVRIASANLGKDNQVMSATILASSKAGAQLYASLKTIDGQLQVSKTTVVGFTEALNTAKTAKERLAAAAKTGIPDDLSKTRERSTSSLPERQKFDTAVSGLTNIAVANPDTLGAKQIQNIFALVRAGSKQTYSGVLEDARQAIVKIVAAHEQLGSSAKAAQAKIDTLARSSKAVGELKDLFGPIRGDATKNEIQKILSSLVSFRSEMRAAGLNLNDFKSALAAFKGNKIVEDDSIEKLRQKIIKVSIDYDNMNAAASKAASKQKSTADDAAASLQKQKDAASVRATLDVQFPIKAGATVNEIRPLHALLNTLQSDVEKGKVSVGSFNAAIQAFRAGKPFGDLGSDINKTVSSLLGMEVAWQKTGSTAQAKLDAINKDTAKTAVTTQRLSDAIAATARLKTEGFSIKATASGGEIENFLRLIGRVQATIERGTVSFNDFERVVESLKTGNVDGFSSKLLALRDRIIAIREASQQMGTELAANEKKLAGATTGQQAEGLARGFFNVASLSGTPTELNKIEQALAKLNTLFKDGSKDIKDFDAAIAAIQKKTGIDTLSKAQQELLKALLAVESAADKAGTTEAKAADKAKEALDRQIASANKLLAASLKEGTKAATTAQRQSDAGTASSTAFAAFGPIPAKATGEQLETLKNKIASAVAFVERGKVSLADFNAVLNRVLSGTSVSASPLTGVLGQVERRLQSAQNTVKAFGSASDSVNVQIQNGWNRTNQLFRTLVIGDVLGRLLRSFEQTTAKAAEFSIDIGLLLTLSQNAPSSFNDWANSIRSVSDQLGKPATDVAKAAYDALSNQVIESSADFDKFGVQVGKLAIITRSDLKSSVDAVSGVLNSFNLSINDTSRVSAILFKSIDLGKITMTQLADTLGRLGPIVNQLGIQVEEFNAFLTSTSRAGISVDVAMTQVGQVLNALLKPNEDLQKFFEGLGVSGGEAAISVFGFAGVLQKLQDATGGSSEALAKFFPELRGLRGVVSVLRNDMKEFTSDLEKLRNESGKTTAEAGRIFNQNPGQRFREELEKIRNFFLTQWETTVLNNILKVSQSFGGLSSSVQFLYNALFTLSVPLLTFAALTAGAFKAATVLEYIATIRTAAITTTALSGVTRVFGVTAAAAFGPVVLAIAAISAALVALAIDATLTKSRMSEFARAAREAGDARASATTAEFQQGLDRQVQLTKQSITEQAQAYAQLPAKVRAVLNDVVTAQKEKAKELADSLKESLDLFAGSAKDRLNELKQIGRDIQKGIDTGPKQTEAFNRDVGKGQFDRAEQAIQDSRGSEPQKARALLDLTIQRIQKQTEEQHKAEEELKTTTDIQGVQEKINETFKERLRLLESLASLTQKDAQVRGNRPNAALQASRNLDIQDTQLRRQAIGAPADQRENIRRQLNTNQLIKEFLPKASDISILLGAQKAFLGGEQRIIELAQERAKTEQRISDILSKRAEENNRQVQEAKRQNEELATAIKNLNAFNFRDTQGNIKKEFKDNPEEAGKQLEKLIAEFQKASSNIVDLAGFNNSLTIVRNLRENLAAAQKDASAVGKSLNQELQTQNQSDKLSETSKAFIKVGEDGKKSQDEIAKANKEAEITINKTKESLIASAEVINGNFLRSSAGAFTPLIQALEAIPGSELPFRKAIKDFSDVMQNFSTERAPEALAALKRLKEALQEANLGSPSRLGFPLLNQLNAIVEPNAGISPKSDANKAISDLINNFDSKNLVKTNQELDSFDQKIKDIKKQDTTNILQTQIKFANTEVQATLEDRLEGAKIIAKEAIEKIQQERDKTLKALQEQVRLKTITPEEGAQKTKVAEDTALQQADDQLNKLKKKFADLRNAPEFKNITNEVVGRTTEQVLNTMEQQLNTLQAAGQKFNETKNQLAQDSANTQNAFAQEFERDREKIVEAENAIKQFGAGSIQALGVVGQTVDDLTARYSRLNAIINASRFVGPPAPELVGPPKPISGQMMGGVIRGFASGGFVSDFFSGKFARGVDNIPIMVSRGETVINANASRKFYTQLQAINQNRQPLFNQHSSNTTTNIGDVNVNVTGSSTPSKTARQIGLELKREIRRGNLR